jgi:hypothetical protein
MEQSAGQQFVKYMNVRIALRIILERSTYVTRDWAVVQNEL